MQQVITQSKAKKDVWVEQDAVRKQAQEWVEEAKAKQATEITVESETPAREMSNHNDYRGTSTASLKIPQRAEKSPATNPDGKIIGGKCGDGYKRD